MNQHKWEEKLRIANEWERRERKIGLLAWRGCRFKRKVRGVDGDRCELDGWDSVLEQEARVGVDWNP